MPRAARGRSRPGNGVDKPWADAIRIAVHENTPEGKRKLRAIAEKAVELALAGDIDAMREIGNRLDGKPHQSFDGVMKAGDEFAAVLAAATRINAEHDGRRAEPADREVGAGTAGLRH